MVLGINVLGIDAGLVVNEPTPALAFSGTEARQRALLAMLLVGVGLAIVLATGRRREDKELDAPSS